MVCISTDVGPCGPCVCGFVDNNPVPLPLKSTNNYILLLLYAIVDTIILLVVCNQCPIESRGVTSRDIRKVI